MAKVSRRTQTGDDKRGSAKDRRARKFWMLRTFGNGQSCGCVHCGTELDFDSVQADRIVPGGSYRRTNVQPACARCNRERSDNASWLSPIFRTMTRGQFVLAV